MAPCGSDHLGDACPVELAVIDAPWGLCAMLKTGTTFDPSLAAQNCLLNGGEYPPRGKISKVVAARSGGTSLLRFRVTPRI